MVKIDKLAKYTRHPSKAKKLAKQIKKIQKSQQVGIDSYKKKLIKRKDTKYKIIKKSLTSKLKSRKSTTKKSATKKSTTKKLLSKLTNIIYNKKIIQPDVINIPEMEKNIEIATVDSQPQQVVPQAQQVVPQAQQVIAQPQQVVPQPQQVFQDYAIAIPSYKRSDIIQTHTLAVLNRHNIKPEHITIFVANQEEYDIYINSVPKFLYNNIVIGLLGLKNQRNFITKYYPEGNNIVEMDDDIKNIMQLVVKKDTTKTTKKTVKPIEDLDAFIRRAFEMCIESNIFLWGVYPLVNPHFMTYKITTDLRFIVGPMWGMINRHRKDLQLTVDEKENSERTLQFWVADGAVLRFNNVGIETKYYKNKGGMQSEGKDRKQEALKSVYYLNKMYPTLTKISLKKKNGMPEIKMNRKKT